MIILIEEHANLKPAFFLQVLLVKCFNLLQHRLVHG